MVLTHKPYTAQEVSYLLRLYNPQLHERLQLFATEPQFTIDDEIKPTASALGPRSLLCHRFTYDHQDKDIEILTSSDFCESLQC